ncbi:MAG TPA: signal peptidase I [Candidatus Sumerlaeota bacterium]|nr:MAG: Signal peptidase I T [candidate division BRC1 bacterium ADurb.BinA292]HOE95893.1 signal peptidase I [Candidatus Sumerlaeota bacterium]HOR28123.1 signal peptidase I [Candidatus Sumerlaeota bacterium]HPK02195.1 signal peptidase I [Candidatus Sumerlaeota bacterium]
MTRNSPKSPLTRLRVAVATVILGILFGLLYLVQTRKVAFFEVTSQSMAPTLQEGERFLMFTPSQYRVGDIVVFSLPETPETHTVKRIIAEGPATVEVRDGLIRVNGRPAPPPQGDAPPIPGLNADWTVQPGEVFLAGDNRDDSYDSRDYGPVPIERLQGILWLHPF